jgi:hypothetical protein
MQGCLDLAFQVGIRGVLDFVLEGPCVLNALGDGFALIRQHISLSYADNKMSECERLRVALACK